MASLQPRRLPHWSRWWTVLRRRVRLLLAAAALLSMVVIAVAAGLADALVDHPERAWVWIRQRWFAAPALGVFVAAVGVIVAVTMPRWQQRRSEQMAAAERERQEHQQQEQHTRQHERETQAVQAEWEQRCRSLLALWPLPMVQEASPYDIGVFYSRRAAAYRGDRPHPPYVTRTVDEELAKLIRSQQLILLKGQSRAGKSRTAFEVAARVLGGWRLLVPKDRAALAGLGEMERLPGEAEQVLVWLDDLERYLATEGTGGLDAALLGRWAVRHPPIKVLATIRLEEHGRLAATSGELGRTTRELLNRFDPGALTLPVGFDTEAEQAGIRTLYPDEQFAGGLAEHLAAAHELVDRLEVGQASAPEGAAVVLAAIDWRRAGLDRPVAKADLATLLLPYLTRLRPLMPFREGDVDRGLGWATEPVGRTAALLIADPDPLAGTFRVADPIVDYVERRDGQRLTDPGIWELLLRRTSPREALDVGFAAYSRDEPSVSRSAWQQVIDSSHPDWAPWASMALGMLREEQKDMAGARVAYQQAIDSGHPDAAPEAAANLGDLLAKEGDATGAMVILRQAVDSGHPDAFPRAAIDLGRLLHEQGDVAGAMAIYQRAADSGNPDQAPFAALLLGLLLDGQGDVAGARAAYQQAIDSGHARVAGMAESSLRSLGARRDGVAGAIATFQRVINSGDPDRAPWASIALGMLLEEQEDVTGARSAYKQVIDSGNDAAAARAREALRQLRLPDSQT